MYAYSSSWQLRYSQLRHCIVNDVISTGVVWWSLTRTFWPFIVIRSPIVCFNCHRSFDVYKVVDARRRGRCECFLSLTLVWFDTSSTRVDDLGLNGALVKKTTWRSLTIGRSLFSKMLKTTLLRGRSQQDGLFNKTVSLAGRSHSRSLSRKTTRRRSLFTRTVFFRKDDKTVSLARRRDYHFSKTLSTVLFRKTTRRSLFNKTTKRSL